MIILIICVIILGVYCSIIYSVVTKNNNDLVYCKNCRYCTSDKVCIHPTNKTIEPNPYDEVVIYRSSIYDLNNNNKCSNFKEIIYSYDEGLGAYE